MGKNFRKSRQPRKDQNGEESIEKVSMSTALCLIRRSYNMEIIFPSHKVMLQSQSL